jgi:hypothetical protein
MKLNLFFAKLFPFLVWATCLMALLFFENCNDDPVTKRELTGAVFIIAVTMQWAISSIELVKEEKEDK